MDLHHPQGTNRAQAQMTRVLRDAIPPRPVECIVPRHNVARRGERMRLNRIENSFIRSAGRF